MPGGQSKWMLFNVKIYTMLRTAINSNSHVLRQKAWYAWGSKNSQDGTDYSQAEDKRLILKNYLQVTLNLLLWCEPKGCSTLLSIFEYIHFYSTKTLCSLLHSIRYIKIKYITEYIFVIYSYSNARRIFGKWL